MAIRANYPDIKPSLNLDFANTKQLDPRITFTRTTTATYYDGKTVAKAEENLLLQSQDFTNASWVNSNTSDEANTDTAPDGTSTADTVTATAANGTIMQTYTAVAGSYTFSVWLRRKTGTGDIQIAADSGTWTTKTISATWTRYDVTQTVAAGSKTAGIRIVTDTDEVYAWGAQLEQRSSVTAYTPTTTQAITNYIPVLQTAAAGQARFDHNPVTGESLGLLIEEQRANLLTYSDDFANAAWTKEYSSITSNIIVAPDGTLTGDKLVEDTTNNSHSVKRTVTLTTASHTFSCYAKAAERTVVALIVYMDSAYRAVYFNLSAGAVVAGYYSSLSPNIQSVGNNWYKCSVTFTPPAFGFSPFITIANSTSTNSYTGDGYSGIYIWGAQIEAGSFATSYIPTTSASVTRNADAASITGTNFSSWYRADEGTVYTEINPKALAVSSGVTINDNSTSNRIRVTTNSTSDQSLITTSGTAQATLDGGTPAANTTMKLATAYKVNDFALSLNAGTVATDTSGTVPVVSQLQIGAETTTVGNMTLKKVSYYPKRVSDAELQALTTV